MEKHKNDDIIAKLLEKYGLKKDVDVFEKRGKNGRLHYRIINRRGIDKIESVSEINLDWKIISADKDHAYIDILATKLNKETGETESFHTTGEASVNNVALQPPYILSMAQARAKSRAILGLEGLYKHGFYGEDEADEFSDFIKGRSTKTSSKYSAPKSGVGVEEIPDFLNE